MLYYCTHTHIYSPTSLLHPKVSPSLRDHIPSVFSNLSTLPFSSLLIYILFSTFFFTCTSFLTATQLFTMFNYLWRVFTFAFSLNFHKWIEHYERLSQYGQNGLCAIKPLAHSLKKSLRGPQLPHLKSKVYLCQIWRF